MKKTRTFRKRRPNVRRTFKRFLALKQISNNVTYIKRHTSVQNLQVANINLENSIGGWEKVNGYLTAVTNAAAATPAYYSFSFAFSLADLPDYTDFTNLYDAYKIKGVAIKLTPVYNSSTGNQIAAASTISGLLHLVNDYDDNDALAASEVGVNILRQFPAFKTITMQSSRTIKRYIKPHCVISGFGGAGNLEGRNRWIDCNSPYVQHFGIKGIVEVYQIAPYQNYLPMKIEFTYYCAFKNPR